MQTSCLDEITLERLSKMSVTTRSLSVEQILAAKTMLPDARGALKKLGQKIKRGPQIEL